MTTLDANNELNLSCFAEFLISDSPHERQSCETKKGMKDIRPQLLSTSSHGYSRPSEVATLEDTVTLLSKNGAQVRKSQRFNFFLAWKSVAIVGNFPKCTQTKKLLMMKNENTQLFGMRISPALHGHPQLEERHITRPIGNPAILTGDKHTKGPFLDHS